ncbi:MAG: hypothetical protein KGS47_13730 [Chloroflexi bacterium]|nr:hypothetical protein [Chloroflexota bacterium]
MMRAWLLRIATSLLLGVLLGALALALGRGIGGAWLLWSEQEALRGMSGVLLGGLDGPPASDVRALRRHLARQAAVIDALGARIGYGVAALGAVVGYLWLERRASLQDGAAPRPPP